MRQIAPEYTQDRRMLMRYGNLAVSVPCTTVHALLASLKNPSAGRDVDDVARFLEEVERTMFRDQQAAATTLSR